MSTELDEAQSQSADFTGMTIDVLRNQLLSVVNSLNITLSEAYSRITREFKVQGDNFQVIDMLTGDCAMSFHLSSSDTVNFASQQLAYLGDLTDDELDKQLKALPTHFILTGVRNPRVPVTMRVFVRETQGKVAEYLALLSQTKQAIEVWIGDDRVREKFFYEGLVRQVGVDHFQKLVAQCVSDVQALCKEQLSPEEEAAYKTFYIEALRDVLGHENTTGGQLNSGFLFLSTEHNKFEQLITRNNQMYMFFHYLCKGFYTTIDPDEFEFDRTRGSYYSWLSVERTAESSEMTFESLQRLMADETIDTSELEITESRDDRRADSGDAKLTGEHANTDEASERMSVLRRLSRLKVAQAFGEYTNTCLPGFMVEELQRAGSAPEADIGEMRRHIFSEFGYHPQLIFKTPSVAPLVLGRPTTGILLDLPAFPALFELEEKLRNEKLSSMEDRYCYCRMRALRVDTEAAAANQTIQQQCRTQSPSARLNDLEMIRTMGLVYEGVIDLPPELATTLQTLQGQGVFDERNRGERNATEDLPPAADSCCTIM